jgi:hypothetical protein
MNSYTSAINGHLDIIVSKNEDEFGDKKECWNEILIHGDPEGLRSLASLLLKLADVDQESIVTLPIGAREHEHLPPGFELAKSSEIVIVGRLDAKGTCAFYDRYIPK